MYTSIYIRPISDIPSITHKLVDRDRIIHSLNRQCTEMVSLVVSSGRKRLGKEEAHGPRCTGFPNRMGALALLVI
jgi:hypothetical protein